MVYFEHNNDIILDTIFRLNTLGKIIGDGSSKNFVFERYIKNAYPSLFLPILPIRYSLEDSEIAVINLIDSLFRIFTTG